MLSNLEAWINRFSYIIDSFIRSKWANSAMLLPVKPKKPFEYHYTLSSEFKEDVIIDDRCCRMRTEPDYYRMMALKNLKVGDLIMTAQPVSWIEIGTQFSEAMILGWCEKLGHDIMEYPPDMKEALIERFKKLDMKAKDYAEQARLTHLTVAQEFAYQQTSVDRLDDLYPRNLERLKFEPIVRGNSSIGVANGQIILYQKIKANAFYVEASRKDRRRVALYWGPSYFNHRCRSNVAHLTSPSDMSIQFFALRDIKKGEELFISYTMEHDRETRARILDRNYHFICYCPICLVSEQERKELLTLFEQGEIEQGEIKEGDDERQKVSLEQEKIKEGKVSLEQEKIKEEDDERQKAWVQIRQRIKQLTTLLRENPKACFYCLHVNELLKEELTNEVQYCGKKCEELDWKRIMQGGLS
jgi:hypothetical protein